MLINRYLSPIAFLCGTGDINKVKIKHIIGQSNVIDFLEKNENNEFVKKLTMITALLEKKFNSLEDHRDSLYRLEIKEDENKSEKDDWFHKAVALKGIERMTKEISFLKRKGFTLITIIGGTILGTLNSEDSFIKANEFIKNMNIKFSSKEFKTFIEDEISREEQQAVLYNHLFDKKEISEIINEEKIEESHTENTLDNIDKSSVNFVFEIIVSALLRSNLVSKVNSPSIKRKIAALIDIRDKGYLEKQVAEEFGIENISVINSDTCGKGFDEKCLIWDGIESHPMEVISKKHLSKSERKYQVTEINPISIDQMKNLFQKDKSAATKISEIQKLLVDVLVEKDRLEDESNKSSKDSVEFKDKMRLICYKSIILLIMEDLVKNHLSGYWITKEKIEEKVDQCINALNSLK